MEATPEFIRTTARAVHAVWEAKADTDECVESSEVRATLENWGVQVPDYALTRALNYLKDHFCFIGPSAPHSDAAKLGTDTRICNVDLRILAIYEQ